MSKRCNVCTQVKPDSEFYALRPRFGGEYLQSHCKACSQVMMKQARINALPLDQYLFTSKDQARFFKKTTRAGSGCLEWTAYKNPKGYGMFKLGGYDRLSHLVALHFVGRYNPSLESHHKCGNPSCVYEAHLTMIDPQAHRIIHGKAK